MTRFSARRAGFTLMEVMIAVLILGLGLSSLFSSQAGAIRIAQRARTTTVATLLARCKMGEVEEEIGKKGWPGTNLEGRDECCVGATQDGYRCEWKVERIVLPDQTMAQDPSQATNALQGAAGAAAGAGTSAQPSGMALGAPMGEPMGQGATNPLGNFGIPVTGMGGMGMGMGTGLGASSGDPMAMMVMQYTFPIMKPIIEEQVRRITVRVEWLEGTSTQSFEVVQFIVNELPVLAETVDEETEPQGQTGSGSSQGSGQGSGGQGSSSGQGGRGQGGGGTGGGQGGGGSGGGGRQ